MSLAWEKVPEDVQVAIMRLMAKKGGQMKSEAKAKAARENGKLGGRPKKVQS